MYFSNIRIVLIQTFHPGNIGSAARAMKTMGLDQLYLVSPKRFPDPEANAMAAGAEDLLERVTIVDTLDQAIADCGLVVGTSARDRSFRLPELSPEECAKKMHQERQQYPVALVFGRERMGLHNDEIQQCHFQVNIPANPEYPVMNIASAIQVLSYELFKTAPENEVETVSCEVEYPVNRELELFYTHLDQTLTKIGFLHDKHAGLTMERLRTLFRRARPESKEISLLRGILSGVQKYTNRASDDK